MSPTKMLLLGVPLVVLETEEATLTGTPFALPTRTSVLAWQTVIASDEDVTTTLEVAIDYEGPYVLLDTITLTGSEVSELRNVAATAARFARVNVTVNASEVLVTTTIIAKVANP